MHRIAILPILIFLVVSGCATSPRASSVAATAPRPARINHMVFFKLKNPAEADDLVHDCDQMASEMPDVVSYFAGRRFDTGRAHVDTSFDVGFYMGFNTDEAYSHYLESPAHLAAIDKWKPRWESIRIQDVVDETP